MPQYAKDEIRAAICRAALAIIAEQGYRSATMADIARVAGVSTGNVYRYFPSKRRLYQTVIPPALAHAFIRLLKERIGALGGREPTQPFDAVDPYTEASRRLLEFATKHRLELVILLGKAEGTPHARFARALVGYLVKLAIREQRTMTPRFRPSRTTRFVLAQVYGNFVHTMAETLRAFPRSAAIQQAAGQFATYHLVGLTRLLAQVGASSGQPPRRRKRPAESTPHGTSDFGRRRHRHGRQRTSAPVSRTRRMR